MRRLLFIIVGLFVAAVASAESLEFSGWDGPPIEVRLQVPEGVAPDAPIVFVMHGNSRDIDRYFDDWRKLGQQHGFIVVVPYFDAERFAGSARYNLGHVFDPGSGEQRPQTQWTYAAIEPLFDQVVTRLGGTQKGYTIYGHSAGSQFVHRFLFHVPNARVNRAIAANAGWYTMPDFNMRWPYGLLDSAVEESAIERILAMDVVVLLGDQDTDREDDNLRKTPEADLQGEHRYARGHTFYRVGAAVARTMNKEFNWQIETVAGAGHSNVQMAARAAELIK